MSQSKTKGQITADWWRAWVKPDTEKRSGVKRAAAARLRRAQTSIDALMEPATLDLARRLDAFNKPLLLNRVGILAAVLAHVREEDSTKIGKAAGPLSLTGDALADDGTAILKQGRFRRLLQVDNDELIDQMRRLVHLLGNKANVPNLADIILYWENDMCKRQLVFDYYNVMRETAMPAPSAETPASQAL
jgi:CRISPR type I-E-associated protein CasB/Cse2